MPAASSSPIEPALDQLHRLADVDVSCPAASLLADRDVGRLLVVLRQVPDPRARRGIRHQLEVILAIAVCAVLAGARSFTSIAEWAADIAATDPELAERLGVTGRVPTESTIRRTAQRLDADYLDRVLGTWAAARTRVAGQRRAIAVDGKTLRGSGSTSGSGGTVENGSRGQPRHVMAALDHTHGVVLGQVDVAAKTNEVPMLPVLLDTVELAGAVVTADALHAVRSHADYLHSRGAHYVVTVKGNQPRLRAQLATLPWKQVPVADRSRVRGHGREETRIVKVTAVAAPARQGGSALVFPHAAQAIQVVRRRRPLTSTNTSAARNTTKKWSTETVYAITSLTAEQANGADLANLIRGHWHVENRLHWVRDVTYDEDRSQIRTGNGPRVMATLRNAAITLLRLTGATNIAAALRHHARDPHRPLATLMTC